MPGSSPMPGCNPFVRRKIARHEANTRGRDFIVGDLHGCVGYLDTLMRHVGFDASMDRLFSVGDLVDRGPDSPGALELLDQPWFYPVMGNHDAMLLSVLMRHEGLLPELSDVDQARAEIYARAFSGNGGRWFNHFLRDEARSGVVAGWRSLLREMPLIRVIGSGPGRFHVAHAELIGHDAHGREHPDWCDLTLDQADVEDNPLWDDPRDIWGFDMVGDGVDHVLWGRELRARVAEEDVPDMRDLSRTYVGHTITVMRDSSQLLTAGSHVFLDTGAYRAAISEDRNMGLTLWCHQEDRGWKYNGEKVVDVRVAEAGSD